MGETRGRDRPHPPARLTRRRRHALDDLDDEIRDHIARETEENIARGMTPDEAARAARLAFGNVALTREAARAVWIPVWWDQFVQDVRYGCRIFRRTPAFTGIAILTLALSIGLATAIFNLLDLLLLRPLPVRDPGTLVELLFQYPGDPRMNRFGISHYERYRDENSVFSDLIGTAPVHLRSRSGGHSGEDLALEFLTGNFFHTLGIQPAIGRLINPEDDGAGAAPVAIVSWSYWKNRFALDPAILGTTVQVQGMTVPVVGVAPRAFSGLLVGYQPDVWLPLSLGRAHGLDAVMIVGRLKKGVTIEEATAEMRVLDAPRLAELARGSNDDPAWRQVTLDVVPAGAGLSTPLREQFATPLLVMMGIVGAVLLLACTNIASLLMARAAARQREMTLRVSLGAGRLRIARQVLTESLLLAAAGSLLGMLLAHSGALALIRIMVSGTLMIGNPPEFEAALFPNTYIGMFSLAILVLTTVAFGAAPAWAAFRSPPPSATQGFGSAGQTRSWRSLGNGLVIAQVTVSLVLVSTAGLFVRHLWHLRHRGLGFDQNSVLLIKLDRSGTNQDREHLLALHQELIARLEAIPGVQSATLSGTTPMSGGAGSRFVRVDGFEEPQARRRVMLNDVAPRYFETLRTPLIEGRDFQFSDAVRSPVVIVNQAMARHYFGDRSPLGGRLRLEGLSEPHEIIGVVADAKYNDLRSPAPRTIYLHAFQQGRLPSTVSIRTRVPLATIADEARRVTSDVLRPATLRRVTTLAEQVDASIVPERLIATLSGYLGGLAALLAAIGLYGLLAYTVVRRTGEIGIRMALGATPRAVTWMVVATALGLTTLGVMLGTTIAISTRHLSAQVAGDLPREASGPVVFAAVTMIAIAGLAAYVPARRAARVDPMEALRHS